MKEIVKEVEACKNSLEIEEVLTSFGRDKKRAGARSLARLVRDMVQVQKRYFKYKQPEDLRKAKRLEERVERSCELILK